MADSSPVHEAVAMGLFSSRACPSRQRSWFAAGVALDAIPDGWMKVDGEWIDLNSRRGKAVLRCWAAEGAV